MAASRVAEVVGLVDALAGGVTPTEAMVSVFSDLDRETSARFAERWPRVPDDTRIGVMALAVDLAASHIDLSYTRLGLITLDDPSPTVREAACAVLGENGGREIATRLAAAIESETDPDVLAAAAVAAAPYVLDFELGRLDGTAGQALVAALRRQLAIDSGAPEIRASFVAAVAPVTEEWVTEAIREAYYSEDRTLRLAAVVAMGHSANGEWLDFLDEQTQSDDAEFRRRAADAIGMIASEDAVDILVPLLDDDDPDVVAAALYAFAEIGGPEAVAYLEEFEDRVPEGLESLLEDAAESARTGFIVMRPSEPR